MSNTGKQSDQDIFLSATLDHTFSDAWHGLVRYGLARKREESGQTYAAGIPIGDDYYGDLVTIAGANGYSASGQALMNYGGIYPYTIDLVSNRDNLYAQTDYSITPHVGIVAGFRFEDERGAENEWVYDFSETLERANYDYMLQVNGDFKQRSSTHSEEASRRINSMASRARPGSASRTIPSVPARASFTARASTSTSPRE